MYRIFIFCISFFSVSFLLAEKLPDTFESETIDVSKAYSFFDELIEPKNEFETTKAHSTRVKKTVANSSYFNGEPNKYFYALLDNIVFSYNADKQEGTFDGLDIAKMKDSQKKYEDLYRIVLKKTTSDHERYTAENSFGVKREISSWDEDLVVLVFHNERYDVAQNSWTKPVDLSTAKEAKQNCRAAVRFQIAPQNDVEKLILFYDTNLQIPTINSPYRVYSIYKGLFVQAVSLIFYDKETNEIYWNIDLANYKNQDTLEFEAKNAEIQAKYQAELEKLQSEETDIIALRKAAVQREKKRELQESDFFQDWETPEGDFFGKYVKTQKNIVFFEKEDGTEVQVDLEDLSPQYKDLVKVAKTFIRVHALLSKPRVWNTRSDKKYKAKLIKVTSNSDDEDIVIHLRLNNKEEDFFPLALLSERDKKWFENIYNEFLKAKQRYEEKYSVKLLGE